MGVLTNSRKSSRMVLTICCWIYEAEWGGWRVPMGPWPFGWLLLALSSLASVSRFCRIFKSCPQNADWCLFWPFWDPGRLGLLSFVADFDVNRTVYVRPSDTHITPHTLHTHISHITHTHTTHTGREPASHRATAGWWCLLLSLCLSVWAADRGIIILFICICIVSTTLSFSVLAKYTPYPRTYVLICVHHIWEGTHPVAFVSGRGQTFGGKCVMWECVCVWTQYV